MLKFTLNDRYIIEMHAVRKPKRHATRDKVFLSVLERGYHLDRSGAKKSLGILILHINGFHCLRNISSGSL